MTFTLEEFCRLYIREIVFFTWSASLYSIRPGFHVYSSFLGEFPESHGNIVDDEHCFSSSNGWSLRVDYLDFRGHATSMCPGF